MGNALARLRQKSEREPYIGIVGLHNAGKSTILDKLYSHRYVKPNQKGDWRLRGCELTIWNTCSKHEWKALMKQHRNRKIPALIFVVDSADLQHLPEAAVHLRWLTERPELSNTAFLVFANKQDVADCLDAKRLSEIFNLSSLQQKWAVQECCATKGFGLQNGMKQLKRMLWDSKCSDCVRCEKEFTFDFSWGFTNEARL